MEVEITKKMENMEINSKKQKSTTKKPKNKNIKLGYLFDERMLLHRQCGIEQCPEVPERVMAIQVNLKIKNLLPQLEILKCDFTTDDNLLLIHSQKHIDTVKSFELDQNGLPRKENDSSFLHSHDTYNNYYTSKAANLSASSVFMAVDKVLDEEINGAFLAIRPPGHHAFEEILSGFCFYNNVALGAQYAIKKKGLKKIAIVDWDVHHGNGTQKIFYESSEVLFISFHRYEKGNFYPFQSGNFTEIGSKHGEGYNINIPWNTKKKNNQRSIIGDDEYIYAFNTIVLPILKEFQPELCFVSCGFDAAEGDPLGNLSVTPLGYSYMTKQLKNLMGNKLIIVLEGGYNIDNIARGTEAIIRVLLNQDPPFENFREYEKFTLDQISNSIQPTLYSMRDVNSYKLLFEKYWKSLRDVDTKICKDSNLIHVDHNDSVRKLLEIKNEKNIDLYKYLILSIKDMETFIEENNFIKFKIGKVTYIDSNPIKSIKHKRINYRSLSSERGFRVEGVCMKDKNLFWTKYEGNFDYNNDSDLIDLIKLFLKGRRNQKEIVDLFRSFINEIEEFSKETNLDIINSELVLIAGKKELMIKINNLKNYSIISNNENNRDIYVEGLKSLAEFIDSNLFKNEK